MPRILVLGGGVCGLVAALMLARDGHEVTLLERDPQPVPDSVDAAWETWQRRGVAQFHQAHFLLAGAHRCSTPSCRTSATRSPPRVASGSTM
jgi:2-polyprenyl-6-methoxyphenol hydroxylase-like FAD-dependent oxidoreductase